MPDPEEKPKMPTVEEVQRSLDVALAREAAIVAAVYVNRIRLDFTEGNMLKLTFAEQSPQVATIMARTAVLMTPECAVAMIDLLQKFIKKVEIAGRAQ